LTELEQAFTDLRTNLSNLSNNNISEILEIMQNKFQYVLKAQEVLNKNIQSLIDVENSFIEKFTSQLQNQYINVLDGTKQYSNKLLDIIKTVEQLLTPKTTMFDDLDKLVKNFSYPKMTSVPIFGWSASLQTIDKMLETCKASVTLLIPNPEHLPLEKILKVKRPKRVVIASQFNLEDPKEKEKIKELVNKDNLTIRKLEIGQISAIGKGYQPYLAAERDNEEILFGSSDLESKSEFVGMISQNKSFIDLMGKTVLSDFLTKTKKLSSADFS
jgi:hypothetical protein